MVADERCATPWPHVGLRGPTEPTSLLSMLQHKINPGLEVRLLQPEHAAELFALVDANRAALREWLPWVDATCKVGDSEKFIAEALRERTATRAYQAGIWSMGALVGGIGHNRIDAAARVYTCAVVSGLPYSKSPVALTLLNGTPEHQPSPNAVSVKPRMAYISLSESFAAAFVGFATIHFSMADARLARASCSWT